MCIRDRIWSDKDTLTAARMDKLMAIPYLKTSPYPGFPTDVQSLIMAVMSFADVYKRQMQM